MKIKVTCGLCDGSGQTGQWIDDDRKWQVEDCENCKGKGKIEAEVVDKRKVTKRKALLLPYRC